MELTEIEAERYSRHLRISSFGAEAQMKLKAGRVLVIGAGGLGCPVIQYLTAAGVGSIGIVDADVVSLSNLQRQILYTEHEIRKSKAAIAASKMAGLNSLVNISVLDEFLTNEVADLLFPNFDVVVGATDNYNSRYLIDQKSRQHNIPFVHGAIREFEGQLSVFNYRGSGSYVDIFGDQPAEPLAPMGVVGAIPGIIGSMMALEVIKILANQGDVLCDTLLLFNGLDNSFRKIRF